MFCVNNKLYWWFYDFFYQFYKSFLPLFSKVFYPLLSKWNIDIPNMISDPTTNFLGKSVNIKHFNIKGGKKLLKGGVKNCSKFYIRNWLHVEITSKEDHCWKRKRLRDKFSLWEKSKFRTIFFSPKWRIFKGKTVLMR